MQKQSLQLCQEMKDSLKKSQQLFGINKENFVKKFLFGHAQESTNFLLERQTPSPSQQEGMSIQIEKSISLLMSQTIFKAGQSLKVPVSTTIVASCICHYFFSRKSFLDYDFRDICLGSMFLACKSQQTLRRSYEISSVFDYIFKVYQKQRPPIKVLQLNSPEYDFMKQKVLKMENEILFELGFQVYKLFDIPHRYIGGLLKYFDNHQKKIQICQTSWKFLNDAYKTKCCLYYPGQIIAAAAIYMAIVKLEVLMPPVPWWILLEGSMEQIQDIIVQIQTIYEYSHLGCCNLESIASQINQIALANFGLLNVFPVNYYRKIMLESSGKLKIKQQVVNQELQKAKEELMEQIEKLQTEKDRKEKKKKQKSKKSKKDKKSKKSKKKKHYSSSRSRSRSKKRKYRQSSSPSSGKHQYKNNDENPLHQRNSQITPKAQQVKQVSKPDFSIKNLVDNKKGFISMLNSKFSQKKIEKEKKESQKSDDSQSDQDLIAQLLSIKKNNQQNQPKKQDH